MSEKTIWGIHMDWSLELDPIEKGFVAIGWDKVGDLSKLSNSRDALKTAIAAAYKAKKLGAIPVDAGILFRFAHEMSKGDFVVYPSKPNRMVNLGIVEGDYFFDEAMPLLFP